MHMAAMCFDALPAEFARVAAVLVYFVWRAIVSFRFGGWAAMGDGAAISGPLIRGVLVGSGFEVRKWPRLFLWQTVPTDVDS